jgi:hypothetical protein
MKVRIVLFAVIGASLLPAALHSAAFMSAVLVGLILGVALGAWGAQRTRYLKLSDQLYYVPHTYTGIAVSMLFLGRLIYRALQLYAGAQPHPAGDSAQLIGSNSMVKSPLTVGIFFVLIGYYVCYYSLVLLKSKRVTPEEEAATAASPQ